MSRILIATATAGGGHLAAAAALEEAWKMLYPGDEVRRVDVLDFVSPIYRRAYSQGYVKLVEAAPELYGHIFRRSDNPRLLAKASFLRRGSARAAAYRFVRMAKNFSPAAVLCPHFLPLEALGSVRKWKSKPFTASIVTDFEAHALWIEPSVDRYFVAARETKSRLVARHVPPKRVSVTGIPVSQRFVNPPAKNAARKSLGLAAGLPTLLVLSGGFGMGPVVQILEQLEQVDKALQFVVVAGRNEKLKSSLDKHRSRHRKLVLGFAGNMEELMSAADLIITKPGGLTSSEALAMGRPLLILDPIPGQETANSDYLLEHGAAAKINRLEDLPGKLADLFAGARLTKLAAGAKVLGRPQAAKAICREVRRCIGK